MRQAAYAVSVFAGICAASCPRALTSAAHASWEVCRPTPSLQLPLVSPNPLSDTPATPPPPSLATSQPPTHPAPPSLQPQHHNPHFTTNSTLSCTASATASSSTMRQRSARRRRARCTSALSMRRRPSGSRCVVCVCCMRVVVCGGAYMSCNGSCGGAVYMYGLSRDKATAMAISSRR